MTRIVLENEVNHRNFEISVKKWPKYGGKFLFSNCSLRTRSTCILLFVHTLEHPNSPLFVTRKKISQQTISMTLILFEHEVNHENLEIAIKKWPKMAFLKNLYFQTALSERVRPVFYFLFAHWNPLTLPDFRYEKNLERDQIHDAHFV